MKTSEISFLKKGFSVCIFVLATIVAINSYVGERPLYNAVMAVSLMFASVLLSGVNVWLTLRQQWKRWTAYGTPGVLLMGAVIAAAYIWGHPKTVEANVQLNVAISVAFASMLVSLYVAHYLFYKDRVMEILRRELPYFDFVPLDTVIGTDSWQHEVGLQHVAQERIRAFVGAGTDVVRVVANTMAFFMSKRVVEAVTFDPNVGAQHVEGGKQLYTCVAQTPGKEKIKLSFILDPISGQGIVMTTPA